jgi:hypothetical protein
MKRGCVGSFIRLNLRVRNATQNFMKSLMRMFSEQELGVVFYETVLTLKLQKHTVIECLPLPWEKFDVIPGYFKVSSGIQLFECLFDACAL